MSMHDMALVDTTGKGLVYNGTAIKDRGEMLSLTDMWSATDQDPSKRPYEWSRKEGSIFIEAVSLSHNTPVGRIYKTQRGKGGSTFAHWQIALAYAKYLSPEFHMWCNSVVRSVMEGKCGVAGGLTAEDRSAIGGIVKACTGLVIREQIESILPTLIEPMVAARLAESAYLLRSGKTAKQIWDAANLPPKIKGSTNWFGNRLKEMGCMMEGRADRGASAIRLFDPDKATICLRNGLLHRSHAYVSERAGQGRFKLVEGGK